MVRLDKKHFFGVARGITPTQLLTTEVKNIDMMQIDIGKEFSDAKLKDPKFIQSVYSCFSGMEMKKAAPARESELMNDRKLLLGSVIFLSERKTVGWALIFSTGEIIMPDVNTVISDQRTQSYICEVGKEKIEAIMTTLRN